MTTDRKTATITVSVSVRWWVAPYIRTLGFVAMVMGTEPDWARLESLITRRGIRTAVHTAREG